MLEVGGSSRVRAEAPQPHDHRDHVPTVCSRASSPRQSPWCTRPSPVVASLGVCVWVSQVEDAEGGSGASQHFSLCLWRGPRVTQRFPGFHYFWKLESLRPGPNAALSVVRSGTTSGKDSLVTVITNNIKCFHSYTYFHSLFTKTLRGRNYWPNLMRKLRDSENPVTHQVPHLVRQDLSLTLFKLFLSERPLLPLKNDKLRF